jgi:hypothetical protein
MSIKEFIANLFTGRLTGRGGAKHCPTHIFGSKPLFIYICGGA